MATKSEKEIKAFQELNLKEGDLISSYYTDKTKRHQLVSKVISSPYGAKEMNKGEGVYSVPLYVIEDGNKRTENLNKGPFWNWYWTFQIGKKYVPYGEYGTGRTFVYKEKKKLVKV